LKRLLNVYFVEVLSMLFSGKSLVVFFLQLVEQKKRADEGIAANETFEDVKKKLQKDTEALQLRIEQLIQENDKLVKSKRNIQAEVCCNLFMAFMFSYYR
jgi:cell division protein FtsB